MKKSINTMELLAKAISPKNNQTQTELKSSLLKHNKTSLIVFDLDGVLLDEYLPELAKLVDKEKEVDVKLEVIPRIEPDNKINLTVHPSIEEIVGYTGPGDFPQPITSIRDPWPSCLRGEGPVPLSRWRRRHQKGWMKSYGRF